MVAVHHIHFYLGVFEGFDQWFCDVDVIDTPALVTGTGTAECAPPAVLIRVFVEMAEGVDKTMI